MQLQHTLPKEQALTIRGNLLTFKRLLHEAALRSSDPPHYPPVLIPRETKPLAGRGWPAASVDPQLLKDLTSNYGSAAKIGRLLGFSARTIWRLQLKLNLVPDRQAPFQSHVTEDGTEYWTHHVAWPRMSDLSDEELDAIVREILTDYPRLGRTMLCGAIARCGLRVSQERAKNMYEWVHGPPRQFGRRSIPRQSYCVPGANSLWHHDGNHSTYWVILFTCPLMAFLELIHWKFVVHMFVDGHTRAVTGIRVSGNNWQRTILNLFLKAIRLWGVPMRCRGDHGIENTMVAQWMYNYRGTDGYIWGRWRFVSKSKIKLTRLFRSVHNTRVERPWVDVGEGFLKKWISFFEDLERHHGLERDNDKHLGLLHLLFLADLNDDAQRWVHTWNAHKIAIRGRKRASPNEMFLESQLVDGYRGFEHLLPNDPLCLHPDQNIPNLGFSDQMLEDLRNHSRRGCWQVDVPGCKYHFIFPYRPSLIPPSTS